MAAAMAGFTMNDAITKAVSSEMNFGQMMLVRGVVAIAMIAALAWHQGALRPLRTLVMKPVALRVAGEVLGTVTFLAAIVHLPLANTAAIFQALPLAVTLGAALMFGEPVGWRRWLAIAAGFIGVLIIVRPGVEGFNQFSLFALISVFFCAVRDLATRRIPAQVPSLFITLVTTVTVTLAGAAIIIPLGGWTPPSSRALGLLTLAAVLLLIGYQCVIMALRSGDISAVAPFRYTSLIWSISIGILFFSEEPDVWMVTGVAIIIVSGLYTFARENKRRAALAQQSEPGSPK